MGGPVVLSVPFCLRGLFDPVPCGAWSHGLSACWFLPLCVLLVFGGAPYSHVSFN